MSEYTPVGKISISEDELTATDENNGTAKKDPETNVWVWTAPVGMGGGRRRSQKKGGRKSKKCSGGKKSKKQQKGGKRRSQKNLYGGKRQKK